MTRAQEYSQEGLNLSVLAHGLSYFFHPNFSIGNLGKIINELYISLGFYKHHVSIMWIQTFCKLLSPDILNCIGLCVDKHACTSSSDIHTSSNAQTKFQSHTIVKHL